MASDRGRASLIYDDLDALISHNAYSLNSRTLNRTNFNFLRELEGAASPERFDGVLRPLFPGHCRYFDL